MQLPPGFEWDPEHAEDVERQTGFHLSDGVHVFNDPDFDYLQVGPEERNGEPRYRAIGRTQWGTVVMVAYTMRAARRRLIWIRAASRREQEAFYESQ